MKKVVSFILIFLLFGLFSCKKKNQISTIQEGVDISFGAYIESFPSGTISNHSAIQINLAKDVNSNFKETTELPDDWFTISPKIKGKAYWVSSHSIVYKTEENLKSDEQYTVTFQLGKALANIPKEQEVFSFSFKTIKQEYDVTGEGVYSYENTKTPIKKYKGYILTADYIESEAIEKVLEAKYNGKQRNINWSHTPNGRQHYFVVDSLERGNKEKFLKLEWDGAAIGLKKEGELEVEIPAIGTFKIMDVLYFKAPEQHLEIQFSDVLDKNQNLKGFISIGEDSDFRFIIEGSVLKVYPSTYYSGTETVRVESIISNVFGTTLGNAYEMEVTFEDIAPAVKLLGKGVISPSSTGLVMPFEAVGLTAVDVRIIEIFEKNIPQFLQGNKMGESSQLRRVGRLILQKKVELAKKRKIDLRRWNAFTLDLSRLITVDPGAIYRVELRFRKAYAKYNCGEEEVSETPLETDEESFENELSEWDSEGWYGSYYYPENYNWEERDNPCSNSYYNGDRFVSRNIFASNLALIAKSDDNNKMTIAVSNITTAQPESGVKLRIVNFQNQEMGKATTGNDGFAEIQLDRKPYLLLAEKGNERGYLRLDDGSALSVSNFDIDGLKVQKGVKGFIYGERGVWRPGDNIYLTFILDDTQKSIPHNHPVVFELKNPQGQTVVRKIKKNGKNGFYSFVTSTDEDAPTGRWTAKVKVGGVSFYKTLKIETVKPNRLKIKLDFDTNLLKVDDKSQKANLIVKWLHGATAKNLKSTVTLMFGTQKTKFEGYPRFTFDDPAKNFQSEEQSLFDGQLNSEGEAIVKLNLEGNNTAPGMLNAYFTTRAFEEAGDFSIDMQKIAFAPYTSFVGMRMPEGKDGWFLTDTNHWIDVASVNADGTPTSVNNLQVEVFKIDWCWWWDASDENLASYIQRSSTRKVFTKTVSTQNGKGRFKLNIPYRDWHDYGRYLIRVSNPQSGHSTGEIAYFSKWYGRVPEGMPGNAKLLSFTTDKKKYKVGETATVTIPSSKGGKALVSLELGTKILKTLWLDTEEHETEFSFDISQGMAPNAYVSVMLIQPHAQTINDRPIRMYGICPILVEDEDTKLSPQIEMKNSLVPEKDFTVKVSEKKGRLMTYTLAVVDEGLLDLTGFKTPNPWDSFYAREALGIKTWDLYDEVMGAFGARLEKAFAIGGDEDLDGEKATKANRFKPVVMFLGPFTLEKGASKTHKISMPNYVGSVRTMIVAGNKGAYGIAEKAVPVRKPLMVLATLPRVLGPTETVKLPVTVFAMESNIKDVRLKIEANELLKIKGAKEKVVHFSETGEQVINFDLEVAAHLGIGKVKVIAQSGATKATYDIALNVRNPNPRITVVKDTVLQKGQKWTYDLSLPGMKGTNRASLELSGIPLVDFGRRLEFLIDYPHGCLEQTTSSVFPQLFLSKVVKLTAEQKSRIKENVQAGLSRLMKFQLPDGGFSYWPGQSTASDWATSYAGSFILKAEEMGYSLPVGMKKGWISYQKSQAKSWNRGKYQGGTFYRNSPLLQAYRLYTLALAGEADLSAMNRLREQKEVPSIALWRLAAAYQLAGQENVAKDIVNGLGKEVKAYRENSGSYGSGLRDKAMILETLSLMKKQSEGFPLMKDIAKQMSSERWMSTQTTAYCLVAISQFVGNNPPANLEANYSINGSKTELVKTKKPVAQFPISTEAKKTSVGVENKSDGMMYVRVNMSGIPVVGSKQTSQENLQMRMKYQDLDGNEIAVSKIKQGTDFKAIITISNVSVYGSAENLALTQIFPSGWEILNTRFGETATTSDANMPTYQDIRDDRVYSYFDLAENKTKTFTISLNAAYVGRYYLPTIACQAMYNDKVQAQIPGQWVEVVK